MIDSYEFGRMTVGGRTYYDDLKIIEDQVIGDWWRRRGHAIHAEDIADILSGRVDTLVVGTGEYGLMKVTPEAAEALSARGIELVCMSTTEAVAFFNRLHTQGKRVAAAFHLAC